MAPQQETSGCSVALLLLALGGAVAFFLIAMAGGGA